MCVWEFIIIISFWMTSIVSEKCDNISCSPLLITIKCILIHCCDCNTQVLVFNSWTRWAVIANSVCCTVQCEVNSYCYIVSGSHLLFHMHINHEANLIKTQNLFNQFKMECFDARWKYTAKDWVSILLDLASKRKHRL